MEATIPAPAKTPAPPTVHERALITWSAIFPLVVVSQWILGPFVNTWPLVLQMFAMTLVVVPVASYLVLPRLMALYVRLTRR